MLKAVILLAQFVLFATCYEIEMIDMEKPPVIGESPHWDADTNSWYYIDLFSNDTQLYRYDYGERKTYSAHIEGESGMPGFILPVAGRKDKYIVGLMNDVKVIKWDGKSKTAKKMCTQFTMDKGIPTNRIHDSVADPNGDFYGGTTRLSFCSPFSKLPSGHVFKSTDGKPTTVIFDNMNGPNALRWDTKLNKAYFVDSCKQAIIGYDWNPVTTELTNGAPVFDLKEYYGLGPNDVLRQRPDGMAIDTLGNLFLAVVNSSSIFHINPTQKKVIQQIKLPVPNVQSVAFGGRKLDILLAVTSNFPLSAITGLPDPTQKLPVNSGKAFMIKGLGVKGFNGQRVKESFASCAPKKSILDRIFKK